MNTVDTVKKTLRAKAQAEEATEQARKLDLAMSARVTDASDAIDAATEALTAALAANALGEAGGDVAQARDARAVALDAHAELVAASDLLAARLAAAERAEEIASKAHADAVVDLIREVTPALQAETRAAFRVAAEKHALWLRLAHYGSGIATSVAPTNSDGEHQLRYAVDYEGHANAQCRVTDAAGNVTGIDEILIEAGVGVHDGIRFQLIAGRGGASLQDLLDVAASLEKPAKKVA